MKKDVEITIKIPADLVEQIENPFDNEADLTGNSSTFYKSWKPTQSE
jgi:hypothetical protein